MNQFIKTAEDFLGRGYKKDGLDCSGLIRKTAQALGIYGTERHSKNIYRSCIEKNKPLEQVERGDVMYVDSKDENDRHIELVKNAELRDDGVLLVETVGSSTSKWVPMEVYRDRKGNILAGEEKEKAEKMTEQERKEQKITMRIRDDGVVYRTYEIKPRNNWKGFIRKNLAYDSWDTKRPVYFGTPDFYRKLIVKNNLETPKEEERVEEINYGQALQEKYYPNLQQSESKIQQKFNANAQINNINNQGFFSKQTKN